MHATGFSCLPNTENHHQTTALGNSTCIYAHPCIYAHHSICCVCSTQGSKSFQVNMRYELAVGCEPLHVSIFHRSSIFFRYMQFRSKPFHPPPPPPSIVFTEFNQKIQANALMDSPDGLARLNKTVQMIGLRSLPHNTQFSSVL